MSKTGHPTFEAGTRWYVQDNKSNTWLLANRDQMRDIEALMLRDNTVGLISSSDEDLWFAGKKYNFMRNREIRYEGGHSFLMYRGDRNMRNRKGRIIIEVKLPPHLGALSFHAREESHPTLRVNSHMDGADVSDSHAEEGDMCAECSNMSEY